MDRRDAIKTLVVVTAGSTLLAGCEDKASITLTNIPLTGSQEDLVAAIAETLIPKTENFVGAQDLRSHEFALVMMDDCASPEDQKLFTDAMTQFDEACKAQTKKRFAKLSPEDRRTFLLRLEARETVHEQPEVNENIMRFYTTMRQFTIRSFTTSEQYLTQIRDFNLVPPPFQACVPVPVASTTTPIPVQ
ncbi:MAG: gluconate 2-dehydrogenase subunit 3 family protein [Bacteroidia bacterium]|nr:gluconate 2-dehydrogenase subunit 3 family protein [Bacteroidia bacterium]